MVRIERIDEWFALYGHKIVWGLVILLAGVIAAGLLTNLLRRTMRHAKMEERLVSMACKITYSLIIACSVIATMFWMGFQIISIVRIVSVVILAVVLISMILRRYYPAMPFKIGNTVEAAGLLGQVEGISVLNTRLKTFDGKTVFIPNRMILNDKLVNYHFTPNRQIRLEFAITYDADLLRAKAVLAEILAEEPRVLDEPPPRVLVTELGESSVNLAARPWVKNKQYFRTRCDLIEKVKLRFDLEGIRFAFPQRDIHFYNETARDVTPAD